MGRVRVASGTFWAALQDPLRHLQLWTICLRYCSGVASNSPGNRGNCEIAVGIAHAWLNRMEKRIVGALGHGDDCNIATRRQPLGERFSCFARALVRVGDDVDVRRL
jgi:hypothetical protein